MKFKRGINITLSGSQSITIPNDEFWKVTFPTEEFSKPEGSPSTYARVNGNHPLWRNPINVVLGPKTEISSDRYSLNLTGLAFTAD